MLIEMLPNPIVHKKAIKYVKTKLTTLYNYSIYPIRVELGLAGYGIQFGIQKLSGSLYLNMFLIGIIGAPLSFLTIYLTNW